MILQGDIFADHYHYFQVFYRKGVSRSRVLKLDRISRKSKGEVAFQFCISFDSSNNCYVSIEELDAWKKDAWTFTIGVDGFNVGETDGIAV